MPPARMAHNGVANTRYNNLNDDALCRLKDEDPIFDELDLPAHEPRMEDGLFVARRTVKNRR